MFGSIFFSKFYAENFTLYINGNGGFIGNYLSNTSFLKLMDTYERFSYYFLIMATLFLFTLSINFNPKNYILNVKKIFNYILKKNSKIIQIKMNL